MPIEKRHVLGMQTHQDDEGIHLKLDLTQDALRSLDMRLPGLHGRELRSLEPQTLSTLHEHSQQQDGQAGRSRNALGTDASSVLGLLLQAHAKPVDTTMSPRLDALGKVNITIEGKTIAEVLGVSQNPAHEKLLGAETAYPAVREVLSGLNKPGSPECMQAKQRIAGMLDAIMGGKGTISADDLDGATFFDADRNDLERRYGVPLFPSTVRIPGPKWHDYYVEDTASEQFIEGFTKEQALGADVIRLLGVSTKGEVHKAIHDETAVFDAEVEGQMKSIRLRKGAGLVLKLQEPESAGGVSFPADKFLQIQEPFRSLGGFGLMTEESLTHHEDGHRYYRLAGKGSLLCDELFAYRLDVLDGRITKNQAVGFMKDKEYGRRALDSWLGQVDSTSTKLGDKAVVDPETLQRLEAEVVGVKTARLIERAWDRVESLDERLGRNDVSGIILNADSLNDLAAAGDRTS